MKKIIITFIAFILLGIIAIGIFSNDKKENTALEKITVAEVAHSIFYTPMYVTDALRYFEDEGLDVNIILTSGADAVAAAVISGDAQIGFCGSEQSIYIYNEGAEDYLINFAGLTKRDGSFIMSRKDEDFKIENLIDKHIIAGREGGMPAMTLAYTLYEKGITKDELNFDTSIAFASMSGAFVGGTGDYVTLFEPTGLQLEKQGHGYVVASLGELGGSVPYTTFNTKLSYFNNNKKTIESFVKAIQKGIDYTFSHSEKELAEIISNYFPDTSLNDLKEAIKRYKDVDSWFKTTYISEDGYNRVLEIMKYNKVLKEKVPYEILINNEYSKKP